MINMHLYTLRTADSNYEQHVAAALCPPQLSPDEANRCPLCHKDIAAGDDGWRSHFIEEGCSGQNRQKEGDE
jgi:centrosomal protein CEP104